MVVDGNKSVLRLGLPKGRMQETVFQLMAEIGMRVHVPPRGYRPTTSENGLEIKILKPQNIVKMLHAGSRDIGFAGADWVEELQADVVELVDTGFDAVTLVAATPAALLEEGHLPKRQIVVASEYARLTAAWIARRNLVATFVRSYGATEVFPPEDADCIVDVSASGDTLQANQLQVIDHLMTSSTRLYANPSVLKDPAKRKQCDRFVMLIKSVLEARRRVMIEVNVRKANLLTVIELLPCMRQPTISPLHGDDGYAIKAAIPREQLSRVIPEIKACGGTDIVVSTIRQIIP